MLYLLLQINVWMHYCVFSHSTKIHKIPKCGTSYAAFKLSLFLLPNYRNQFDRNVFAWIEIWVSSHGKLNWSNVSWVNCWEAQSWELLVALYLRRATNSVICLTLFRAVCLELMWSRYIRVSHLHWWSITLWPGSQRFVNTQANR